jgi:hypothetical protein
LLQVDTNLSSNPNLDMDKFSDPKPQGRPLYFLRDAHFYLVGSDDDVLFLNELAKAENVRELALTKQHQSVASALKQMRTLGGTAIALIKEKLKPKFKGKEPTDEELKKVWNHKHALFEGEGKETLNMTFRKKIVVGVEDPVLAKQVKDNTVTLIVRMVLAPEDQFKVFYDVAAKWEANEFADFGFIPKAKPEVSSGFPMVLECQATCLPHLDLSTLLSRRCPNRSCTAWLALCLTVFFCSLW